MKKILVSALLAAGMIGAVAIPVSSVAAVEIWVQRAPPPVRCEVVPAPRRGYVWAPGHWQWNANRNRHTWTVGYWERARPGYVFQAPQWVERDGHWNYQPRRWDNDGDGIPNNRDATPNGGRQRGDSDRDGVPDRFDRRPNNPNRS
ncbi:MAG: hypothetical protein Q7R45_00615 [Sulfuricaulis sp.]|nr:hypothetical protein [Sulfuricaulis sp.]